MLDDRERRLWRDIERRLTADDPSRPSGQDPDRPRPAAGPLVWTALCYVVTVMLVLVAGWTAALLGVAAFLVVLPFVLRRGRR